MRALKIGTPINAAIIKLMVHHQEHILKRIALTGESGGKLKALSDICICAPAKETFAVQEYHLPVYHAICAAVETYFFSV